MVFNNDFVLLSFATAERQYFYLVNVIAVIIIAL